MRKFKYFALIVLLLTLVACGGDDDSTAAADDPADDETEEVVDEATEDEEVEEENEVDYYQTPEMDFDLGGDTITVVAWWDNEISGDSPDLIQAQENLAALEEKHNFTMEFVMIDYMEYQERVIASLIANEPIGDIVRLAKNYTVPALVQQDLVWELDEWVNNEHAFNTRMTDELFTHEGSGYGFTDDHIDHDMTGLFYNRTLMNELGLDAIQNYIDEDNWNWDTFKEVVASANQDTDNDGNIDTWGLANRSVLPSALASNDAALTDGGQQALEYPETMEAMEFVASIGREALARPTEGGDWTEPRQFFQQGNTLFYNGAYWETNDLMNDMPEYDIGFVPFPKGPNADDYRAYNDAVHAYAIPKVVDNPEQLLYIWEKIYDIDSVYDYYGQAVFEADLTNEDDINNIRGLTTNIVAFDHFAFPDLDYYALEHELAVEGTPVSTVIETYAQSYQAAIDNVYGE